MNHDELAERIASALEINSESEQTEELTTIGNELLTNLLDDADDKTAHEAILFVQQSIDTNDPSVNVNPYHLLMGILGDSQELFDRMTIYVPAQQTPETTADDS